MKQVFAPGNEKSKVGATHSRDNWRRIATTRRSYDDFHCKMSIISFSMPVPAAMAD